MWRFEGGSSVKLQNDSRRGDKLNIYVFMERVSASPPRAILLFLWSGGVSIRILADVTGARTSAQPSPGCSHLGGRSSGVSSGELGGPRSVAAQPSVGT